MLIRVGLARSLARSTRARRQLLPIQGSGAEQVPRGSWLFPAICTVAWGVCFSALASVLQAPAAATDLISILQALPDCRIRRGAVSGRSRCCWPRRPPADATLRLLSAQLVVVAKPCGARSLKSALAQRLMASGRLRQHRPGEPLLQQPGCGLLLRIDLAASPRAPTPPIHKVH